MRRFVQFLLLGGLLVIPAVAQRGGGFRGRGVVDPGVRADGLRRFPYRGSFPENRFVGFGIPSDWPDDSVGGDSPDNFYGPADTNINYEYTPPAPAAPKVTDYRGPGLICPQTNGKRLYRIAIPAGAPGRNRHQDNIWVAHNYWYTKGTLNFVTREGEQKQTPISFIDSAITLQLNRECGLNFELPK